MVNSVYSYDVHGLRLDVRAESEKLLQCAQHVLNPYLVSTSQPNSWQLRIRHGQPPTEGASGDFLPILSQGTLPDGIELVLRGSEELQQIDLVGLARVVIDTSDNSALITVSPGAEWCLPRGCLVLLICELLTRSGQKVVHTGAVMLPDSCKPGAILIAGASGRGKTTTCLALANSGMKLMADDACFIRPPSNKANDDALTVWGLLLDSKVHVHTLEMLDWLKQFPSRPAIRNDERLIDVRPALGIDRPVRLKPRGIFFLDEHNDQDHRLTRIGQFEALALLTTENVRAPATYYYSRAASAFETMARLARSCPLFLLSVGPDLQSIGRSILREVC